MTTITTTTTTTTTPQTLDIYQENFPSQEPIENHKNLKLLPTSENCGQITNGLRITSGIKAQAGEFPWMALIAYSSGILPDFRCGGTIINENFILTAAHCIENSTLMGIRLGEHDLLSDNECIIQDFFISKFIIHPLYDPLTFLNDIALVKLKGSANFSLPNVKPICLPLWYQQPSIDLASNKAIVAGWGVTQNGQKSPILLKVEIPVVPLKECQTIYQAFKPITKNQICAGGSMGKDSCAGDSGGPLMKQVSGRFIQFGIVSYGPRYCGLEGRPGIYTKIEEYLRWILDNLEE